MNATFPKKNKNNATFQLILFNFNLYFIYQHHEKIKPEETRYKSKFGEIS